MHVRNLARYEIVSNAYLNVTEKQFEYDTREKENREEHPHHCRVAPTAAA